MTTFNDPIEGLAEDAIQDYVSERAVLGWLLAKPDHWQCVTEEVRPEDFFVPIHAKVCATLFADGHQTAEELADRTEGALVAVFRQWAFDAAIDLDVRDVRRRAVRVARLAMRRKVVDAAKRMTLDADDPNLTEDAVIEKAKDRLDQIVAPHAPPDNLAQNVDTFLAGINYEYDWLIPDLVERRDRMIVTGTGGTGKSTLLRQIALCSAGGIHPFAFHAMRPVKVLLLDLENSERQVGRKLQGPLEKVGPFDASNLKIVALPKVIDVTTDGGWRWLAGQVEAARPDMIVGGPVYRMFESGDSSRDMGGKDKAVQVAKALDRLRFRYDCALILEAHPTKGGDSLAPWGSMVWTAWPEFGIGLRPDLDGGPGATVVDVEHWRYPRDDRDWPKKLTRGGAYGFGVVR